MSGWFGCATAPEAAVSNSKCYTGVLSAASVHALVALDPVGYARVSEGDLMITPECARAQLQGLADDIRMLGAP